jgi:hypothetical protein
MYADSVITGVAESKRRKTRKEARIANVPAARTRRNGANGIQKKENGGQPMAAL